MRLSDFATNVARSTQAAVLDHVAEHGRARGLAAFARAVGVTLRRARSLAEGTAGRIDAAEYLAAREAQAALLRQRIARANHQLNLIEAALHGVDLEPAGAAAVVAGRAPDGLGRSVHGSGAALDGA